MGRAPRPPETRLDLPETAPPVPLSTTLLTPSAVPGPTAGYRWRGAAPLGAEPAGFATCHRVGLRAIGAAAVAGRSYRPDGDDSAAGHLVARFPDTETATRAYAVLTAWHQRCAELLAEYRRADVGRLLPVDVHRGRGTWYQLRYAPAAEGSRATVFDATGLVLRGDLVAVLHLRTVGLDLAGPAGSEPMARAVRRAATLLG